MKTIKSLCCVTILLLMLPPTFAAVVNDDNYDAALLQTETDVTWKVGYVLDPNILDNDVLTSQSNVDWGQLDNVGYTHISGGSGWIQRQGFPDQPNFRFVYFPDDAWTETTVINYVVRDNGDNTWDDANIYINPPPAPTAADDVYNADGLPLIVDGEAGAGYLFNALENDTYSQLEYLDENVMQPVRVSGSGYMTASPLSGNGPTFTYFFAGNNNSPFTEPAVFNYTLLDYATHISVTRQITINPPTPQTEPPQAVAPADFNAIAGQTYTLDGSGSTNVVSYSWTQSESGTNLTLSNNYVAAPTFTAPSVSSQETITLTLTVGNSLGNDTDEVNITLIPNGAPTAAAGPNQPSAGSSIVPGQVITLDGSNSTDDIDASTLTYSWMQIAGTPVVALNNVDTAIANFAAPSATGSLVFELTVCDSSNQCDTDVTIISLSAGVPTAQAGANQNVAELASVQLDGSNSFDADGVIVSYQWLQIGGATTITLSDDTAVTPTFIAPSTSDTLKFRLTVTDDSGLVDDDDIIVNVSNLPIPNCDAGSNQSVNEFNNVTGSPTQVQLDGSNSSIANPSTISSYLWSQASGPSVNLNNSSVVNPVFSAPEVDSMGASLTFTLTCTSDTGTQSSDQLSINVSNNNRAPVATAEDVPQTVEGNLVALNAANSYDPDGDTITFSWSINAGIAVTLSNPNSASPTFIAPDVGSNGGFTEFRITVSDGTLSASYDVSANYGFINIAPVAAIDALTNAAGRSTVNLSGNNSTDVDGQALTYLWSQTSGSPVSITGLDSALASFTAPDVGVNGEPLGFQLQVSDGALQNSAQVSIQVDHNPTPQQASPQNRAISTTSFTIGSGESIVLDFSIVMDAVGTQMDSLTFAGTGTANEMQFAKSVSLYVDTNNNGVADTAEKQGSTTYSSDNGSVIFSFVTPLRLPVGATRFLLTYEL